MKHIAFIGVGIMGKSMVRKLMAAGFHLTIYSRTRSKCEDLLAEGAVWADSVADCVKEADAVCSIVGYPKDVEKVYFGPNGILDNTKAGAYTIDMTTTSPALATRIHTAAKDRGLHPLDAPVTGGDTGAKAGTLTILIGGERDDFDACLSLFEAMGKNIVYMGGPGMGQHAKMANQIAIAGTLSGICEALAYARAKGLNSSALLSAISAGSAGSFQMSQLAPKMVAGDFNPGFILSHFIKDMGLADGEALHEGVALPVLELVLAQCRTLEAQGLGHLGTQSLIQYYER
jgi:3-hydroxyisobutyrate dehydrogenase